MKILERYVVTSYLSAFCLAWLVLSFVLSVGLLVKVTRLVVDGLPLDTVGRYLLSGLPEVVSMTIPLALLVSALLVFGRLSADSEVSAMRACGVNFMTIMRWPLLIGLLFTIFGVYLNNEIAPRGHQVRRNILANSSIEVGLELLEPGRFIEDIPDMTLWFATRDGNWLHDVLIFDRKNPKVIREIRAEKALVTTNGADVVLDMYQVRIDPVQDDQPGAAVASRISHVLKNALKSRTYSRKIRDYGFGELWSELRRVGSVAEGLSPEARRQTACQLRFELNRRLVWSAAAFCFVLIGVPLGIKAHRRESSVGMAISLVVGVLFFLCLLLAESVSKRPEVYPYVLLWLPVLACFALAAVLIPKNQ